MTTIDAVAAWRARKSLTPVILVSCMGFGLAGCESAGTNLFGLAADGTTPATVAGQATPPATAQTARMAVAPIIGAPESVAKQLQIQLTAAIERQQITVAKAPNDKAEFTVRGYVVSAREKAVTKVPYIWDVTDASGKRVNRITGEEVVSGAQGKDPWVAVTPQIIDTISNKTAGSLATWLQTQVPAAVATTGVPGTTGVQPVAASGAGAGAMQTAASPSPLLPPQPQPKATPAAQTTGSIDRSGTVNAMVPSVSGAPGDGSVTLTGALQRELTRNGVPLTDKPSGQTYRVEGKVVVGEGKDGRQPIQIDWSVKDPQGKNLGTVSQKNEIPQGSLDGAWGKTADAAAAAAAQGILKLLPAQTRVN